MRRERQYYLCGILSIVWFCFESCTTDPLIVGEREMKRGNYIDAQRAFEQAISNGSDSLRSYPGLGIAKFLSADSSLLSTLRKADSVSAHPTSATFLHAIAAQEKGFPSEALEAYTKSKSLAELQPYTLEIDAMRSFLMPDAMHETIRQQLDAQDQEANLPPNTLAVLPVSAPANDSLLSLIAIGYADFLTTDFSKAKSLTVVERNRLQDIFTELNRYSANYDVSSLPKKGKLLGAAKLVDCSMTRKRKAIVIEARIIKTVDGKVQTSGNESGSEEKLFTLEKQLVLNLLRRMKVNLTAEEQRDILIPQTENLLAFYAYCRGLKAADQLDYENAATYFDEASKLDPAFQVCEQKRDEMKKRASPPQSLRYLTRILFPVLDPRFDEALIRTAGCLLESGFINAGNARRDGPAVLPFPPVP